MPVATTTAAALPLANFRARISAAIDRHTANSAGTVAGVAVRGCWRREWAAQVSDWGHVPGATRVTFAIDAAALAACFAGEPRLQAPAQPWYTGHAQPLAYVDDQGEIITIRGPDYIASTGPLTDPAGAPLLNAAGDVLEGSELRQGDLSPLMSTETRAIGAPVVITAGDGIGTYSIAEVHPHDGGRLLLVLEVSA